MISGVFLISCNIFLHGAVEFQGVVPRQRPMAVSAQCVVFWGLPENRFQILNAHIYNQVIYVYKHIYIYICERPAPQGLDFIVPRVGKYGGDQKLFSEPYIFAMMLFCMCLSYSIHV